MLSEMIAAKQDRQPIGLELFVHGIVQQTAPVHDFGQVPEAIDGRLPGVGRPRDIAAIADLDPKLLDGLGDTRHTQGFRRTKPVKPHGSRMKRRWRRIERSWRTCHPYVESEAKNLRLLSHA